MDKFVKEPLRLLLLLLVLSQGEEQFASSLKSFRT